MRRKILISAFKFLFLAFILFYFFSVKSVHAAFPCTVSPSTVTPNANVTIDGGGNFSSSQKFYVSINGNKITRIGTGGRVAPGPLPTYSPVDGKITFKLPSTYTSGTLLVGVYLQQDPNTNLCNNNPTVTVSGPSGGSGGGSCSIQFINKSFKPSDYVAIQMTGPLASTGSPDDLLHTYVRVNNDSGSGMWDGCVKRRDLTDSKGFGVGYYTTGKYYVHINKECNVGHLLENFGCDAYFYADIYGGGLGGSGNPDNPIPQTPCKEGANVKGTCTQVDTGLGPIGTDPQSLIKSLFGLILSISGGIALLLIIISGYRMLASQGNPEALKGAREQLTAAIVGLLFIIFALVILQIIGVDILRIPGFK